MEISIGVSNGDWAQILTAWAALAAATLGPVAGYLAARHQAHRSVVSVNRQKWVDELRDEIAEFFVACAGVGIEIDENSAYRSKDHKAATKAHIVQIDRLLSTIELRLNPGEDDHRDLLARLRACVEAAITDGNYTEAKDAALKVAKRVLKREWEAVKSGS